MTSPGSIEGKSWPPDPNRGTRMIYILWMWAKCYTILVPNVPTVPSVPILQRAWRLYQICSQRQPLLGPFLHQCLYHIWIPELQLIWKCCCLFCAMLQLQYIMWTSKAVSKNGYICCNPLNWGGWPCDCYEWAWSSILFVYLCWLEDVVQCLLFLCSPCPAVPCDYVPVM